MEVSNCPVELNLASVTSQHVLGVILNKTVRHTTQSSQENPDSRARAAKPPLTDSKEERISEPNGSLRLTGEQGHEDRFLKNIRLAKEWLKATHSTLHQLNHFVSMARQMTIQATGKTSSSTIRKRTAKEIEELLVEIIKTVDSRDWEKHPFWQNPTATSFSRQAQREPARQGNGEETELEIQPGLNMRLSLVGPDFLTEPLKSLGEDGDLNPGIDSHTRLWDLNLGKGVNPGSIKVNKPGRCWDINLRHATTAGEVMDAINSSGIDGLRARINESKTGFVLGHTSLNRSSSGQELFIWETSDNAAEDSRILTHGAEGSAITPGGLQGRHLNPALTEKTPISLLKSGKGIILGTIRFALGDTETVVDLSSASTIGEIIDAINYSIPDVIASVNESKRGISVESKVAGKSLVISDGDERKSAQALRISGSPDIRGALCFLMEGLNKGEGKAILEALKTLDLSLEKIWRHKKEAEAKLKRLESVQTGLSNFQPDAFGLLSEIARKNVSRTAAALGDQHSLLQSALKRGAAMIQPAFLDFMR